MSVFDVVIVGAGAAGIAAARRLHAAGRRVMVLESRPRVGGRVVVDHTLGVPADLGAAWLHFADTNPWTALAEAQGFTVLRTDPGWGGAAPVGWRAPTEATRQAVGKSYARNYALIDAAAAAGRDVAVSEVLPQDEFRARFDAVMTWAVGAESREISTLDLGRYAESGHDWAVREGLGTVVAAVARGLPITTSARVTDLDWSGPRVRIASTAGTLEATSVIVTLPTSLLARDAIRFTPALPQAYRTAFAGVPLGVCNKVFFPLRSEAFAATLPKHFLGSVETSRTCSWLRNTADQPLLLAYFGGDLSRELEQRGELAAFATDELRRLFGAEALTQVGAPIASAWGTDADSLGSYSVALPGHAHCREQLGMPVSPALQFAGEACSLHHYGTIYGAWNAGTIAAERLL